MYLQKVISKKLRKYFLVEVLKITDESGFISQRYGSADPDQDSLQNIMDQQH
jgi:hypothetical protein